MQNFVLLGKRERSSLGNSYYIGYYSVIPGWDQESDVGICAMLSQALCSHWDKIPGLGRDDESQHYVFVDVYTLYI